MLNVRRRTSRGVGVDGGSRGMVAVAMAVAMIMFVVVVVPVSVVGAVIGQGQSGDGQNLKW